MPPFVRFTPSSTRPGDIIVRLYHSGDQIRGYVRTAAEAPGDDVIFPGEEMEPDAAFTLARAHARANAPIFVELSEGLRWDPAWGDLPGA